MEQEELFSEEFYKQFRKDLKKYNSDVDGAIELTREIDEDEKERLIREEKGYEVLEKFGAFV